jgi:hypothetical protein
MTVCTAIIIPPELLERRRRERQERRERWPPEPPILGEDYEAECIALKLKERRR